MSEPSYRKPSPLVVTTGASISVSKPLLVRATIKRFIWLSVETIVGDWIFAKLAYRPVALPNLDIGDHVRVHSSEINDWAYLDENGELIGGYTVRVLVKMLEQKQASPEEA